MTNILTKFPLFWAFFEYFHAVSSTVKGGLSEL